MKSEQIVLKASHILSEDLKKLSAIDPQLVFVFGSVEVFLAKGFGQHLMRHFHGCTLIGCTTAGEISSHGVTDDALIVTGLHFDRAEIKTAHAELIRVEHSSMAGEKIAQSLQSPDLKAVFVLGQGVNVNGTTLVEGMRKVLGSKVVITGGLAGDGGAFKQTYTLLNGEIFNNQVVAFGVYGSGVEISYGSMGGWKPFGPARRVTRSVDNVLYELDGEPALRVYKKYLGEDAKNLPASGLRYPFALLNDNEDTTGLVRTILSVDEKAESLTFAGDIPNGGLVRLMHADLDGLVEGARLAAESTLNLKLGQPGVGILISCVGRKLVMGDDVEEEIDAVRGILGQKNHITGFYSYGEICPMKGFSECKLHNQTMTITWFTESKI